MATGSFALQLKQTVQDGAASHFVSSAEATPASAAAFSASPASVSVCSNRTDSRADGSSASALATAYHACTLASSSRICSRSLVASEIRSSWQIAITTSATTASRSGP